MSDDDFDRSDLEELFGLDALYGSPGGRVRDLDRLMRSSAARELGLADDEDALVDHDSDEADDDDEDGGDDDD